MRLIELQKQNRKQEQEVLHTELSGDFSHAGIIAVKYLLKQTAKT